MEGESMKLADAGTPARPDKGPPCTAGLLWSELDDDDRATLLEWVDDPDIPASKIAEQLRLAGKRDVSYYVITRHFVRRECKCHKDSR